MPTITLATQAMGCRFELVLHGFEEAFLRSAGEEAIETIEDLHARLSAFAHDSVVTRINRAAGVNPVCVDAQTFDLLTLCEETRIASGGLFDATVGRLMEAHGYRRSAVSARPGAGGATTGGLLLDPAGQRVMLTDAGASLDLGGVAKGYALDLIATELREQGLEHAFVHAGTSSVAAFGVGPDGCPWRVGLAGRDEPVELPEGGGALSVSGSAEQGSHAVDPRSGGVSGHDRQCLVVGERAAVCDAWSTVAMVLNAVPPKIPDGYACSLIELARLEYEVHV